MDQCERLGQEYLSSLGFSNIEYEPDGNGPPDLLVDGRIAVEVRRFNQYQQTSDGVMEALDTLSEPFVRNLGRYLENLGPPEDESWWLHFSFTRPLEPWAAVQRELEKCLLAFKDSLGRHIVHGPLQVTPHLEVDFRRASQPKEHLFLLGGFTDDDAGGGTVLETLRSLRVIVPEKERKVAPYKDRYPEWWLVLINYAFLRVAEEDIGKVRDARPATRIFHKVILVNPVDTSAGTEI